MVPSTQKQFYRSLGVLPLKLIPTHLYISYQAEEKQKLTQLLTEVS